MKKIRFTALAVILASLAIGQTKEPITGVKNYKFGMTKLAIEKKLETENAIKKIKKSQLTTTLLHPEWKEFQVDYVDFNYLENNLLYEIYLSKVFQINQKVALFESYQYFKKMLDTKYGEQNIVPIEKGSAVHWNDTKNKTKISLLFEKKKNEEGAFRYYITLSYLNLKILRKNRKL